jgi:polysaccharide biosynthesis/export protein
MGLLMKKDKFTLVLILFFVVSGLSAQAWAQSIASQSAALGMQQPVDAQKVAISPGDVLSVEVFDTPELSTESARVSESGQIDLPVLGLVKVAGLNPIQAAVRIESELRSHGLMLEPHVTVSVLAYASQVATVLGEVKTAGVYPVFGGRRLLDVIALAGGLSPSAGKIVTIAHRDDPHHPIIVRLVQNARSLGAQQNPIIQPDDTIEIGKAGIIYILGAVGRAGGFLIDNNERVSLLQAITLAGGWSKTAALSKALLIRKVPQGHEQLKLDLKHVLKGSQADIRIQNGDILYIPDSLGKTLAYRGMEAVIAAAQTAVVYSSSNGGF